MYHVRWRACACCRCAIPGLPNDTYAFQNEAHEHMVNLTVPQKLVDGHMTYSKCNVYNISAIYDDASDIYRSDNQSAIYRADNKTWELTYRGGNANDTGIPCTRWVYSNALYETTVISDVRNVPLYINITYPPPILLLSLKI
jgi:hypothetical protein